MSSPRTRAALGAVVAVAAAIALPAPAQAAEPVVVATGLDSPRHVTISSTGQIYVAEAGRGGSGPCAFHEELQEDFCLGTTGAITRVDPTGPDTRVVTGLPSIASEAEALGPSDVSFTGGSRYAVTIGIGGSDTFREEFGPGGRWLGTVLTGQLGHRAPSLFADLLGYEATANPDNTTIDSNPTGLLRSGESYYVTDSGGNSLVKAGHKGEVTTRAVFGPVPTTRPITVPGDEPFTLPAGFPADAVPTAVVRGPDDALYVSQLVGFPFEPGSSTIWRIAGGGQPTPYATGLTNVTDLAFAEDGSLYAVQIASGGLLAGPIGSLVKVTPGGSSHAAVATGLFAPYGVALSGSSAYVSTCSVCIGTGQVVRIAL